MVNVGILKPYKPSILDEDYEGQVLPYIKDLAPNAEEKLPNDTILQKYMWMPSAVNKNFGKDGIQDSAINQDQMVLKGQS
jgi:hypothetical protein